MAAKQSSRQQLADEIKRTFGWSLTLQDVMDVLGFRHDSPTKKWLADEGVDAVVINGRKKWLASDIAKALDNSKVRGCVS